VVPGELVYRTGDLAYRDDTGNYCYGGRIDNVIKRSGVRLSLLEISESIRAVDKVSAAACLTFDYDGELGIVAFAVVERGVSSLDLQLATRQRLPESMMPNRFEIVEELPLTRSNKLDERALLAHAGLKAY
jgi:acyl-coenzyme A synthetase/AMP-(fatty) acid ligase